MGDRDTAVSLLTSELDEGECRFNSGEIAPGWVGTTAGLNALEKRKILLCRESNQGRPARSPSVHGLRYFDSKFVGGHLLLLLT
jgi:hypothetical protein